jgi:hypothetical protein
MSSSLPSATPSEEYLHVQHPTHPAQSYDEYHQQQQQQQRGLVNHKGHQDLQDDVDEVMTFNDDGSLNDIVDSGARAGAGTRAGAARGKFKPRPPAGPPPDLAAIEEQMHMLELDSVAGDFDRA